MYESRLDHGRIFSKFPTTWDRGNSTENGNSKYVVYTDTQNFWVLTHTLTVSLFLECF